MYVYDLLQREPIQHRKGEQYVLWREKNSLNEIRGQPRRFDIVHHTKCKV